VGAARPVRLSGRARRMHLDLRFIPISPRIRRLPPSSSCPSKPRSR
jgi:hypothetical protein